MIAGLGFGFYLIASVKVQIILEELSSVANLFRWMS